MLNTAGYDAPWAGVCKQRIVTSTAGDTVYDIWWPDAPHRTLRNKTFDEWDAAGRPPSGQRPGEGTIIGTRRLRADKAQDWPRYAVGELPPTFEGDLDYAAMLAGESCPVVNGINSAGQIVRDLVREAEAALAEPDS